MKLNSVQQNKKLYKILDARQYALKMIANVTYGYTAAAYSGRMPCQDLASTIIYIGQLTLENAIKTIHHGKYKNIVQVIYTDTDSLFILCKNKSKEQAFTIGYDLASIITQQNPSPMKLQFEKIYYPCILLSKKRYVGLKYETRTQKEGIYDAKGIETVRRDTCLITKKIMKHMLSILFSKQPNINHIKDYLIKQWKLILNQSISFDHFLFATETKFPYKSLSLSARIALYELNDINKWILYGYRQNFLITQIGNINSLTNSSKIALKQKVISSRIFIDKLNENYNIKIDSLYYILKRINQAINRILQHIGIDSNMWFKQYISLSNYNHKHYQLYQPNIYKHLTIYNGRSFRYGYLNSSYKYKQLSLAIYTYQCFICYSIAKQGQFIMINKDTNYKIYICQYCLSKPYIYYLITNRNKSYQNLLTYYKLCHQCHGMNIVPKYYPINCINQSCYIFYQKLYISSQYQYYHDLYHALLALN